MHLFKKQPASYHKRKEYDFHKLLGKGTFGEVKQATWTHSQDGRPSQKQEVAIKCIEKRLVKANPQIVLDEMDVLQGLDNDHVVKILDWFESKDKYYLVFEHIEGGELFDQIVKQHHFTEHDAAICIYAILQGVQYLHHKDIAHRDLKPENLLLRSKDPLQLSDIVIADFGVAKHLEEDNAMMKTLVGSPGYSAPELFDKKGYKGPPADIWSIGVIAYALLSGKSPFSQRDADACLEQQRRGEVEFAHSIWESTSDEAKDFIRQCLRVEPDKRPTVDCLIGHAWIQQEGVRSKQNIAPEVTRTITQDTTQGGGSMQVEKRRLDSHEKEKYSEDESESEEMAKLSERTSAVQV